MSARDRPQTEPLAADEIRAPPDRQCLLPARSLGSIEHLRPSLHHTAVIDSLRQTAGAVVGAEPPWANAPTYAPTRAAFPEAALELRFMRRDHLLVCLADAWNNEVLIYRDAAGLWLVQWTTA